MIKIILTKLLHMQDNISLIEAGKDVPIIIMIKSNIMFFGGKKASHCLWERGEGEGRPFWGAGIPISCFQLYNWK